MEQSGGLLGRLLRPLLKTELPLMKSDIIKVTKYLEESGLLMKGVSETIQNEAKEQKGGFLSMLLSTLGASLLGNLLTCKSTNRDGEGTISFMLPHLLTNFEIQKYYQNKLKSNGVYPRNNVPKITDGTYVNRNKS